MAGGPKIGVAEAVSLCGLFIVTKIFLSYQLYFIDVAINAAWLAVLLASMLGFIYFWFIYALLKKYPGKNILEIGDELVGPALNRLFALGYLIFFLVMASLVLRQFSERVIGSFVEDMPISFAVFSFMAGVVIVSYLGLEAIARTARLFAPVLLGLYVFLLLATIPFWKSYLLYPLLGGGLQNIAQAGLVRSGLMSEVFILALITRYLPEKKLGTIGLWSLGLTGAIFVATLLTVQMVFPFPVSSELALPTFNLAKAIQMGRFFQRNETFFLPVWALAGLIKITITLYASAFITAFMLKLPYYRPLIPALSVIIIAVSFIPVSVTQAATWDNLYLRGVLWTVTLFPVLLLLFLGKLKGGKGGGSGAQKTT